MSETMIDRAIDISVSLMNCGLWDAGTGPNARDTVLAARSELRLLREKARWAEKTADYFGGNDLLEPEIELMAEWRALTKEQP